MSTEITDYQKQAIDFLNATSTGMKSVFLKYDFHFPGDDQKRNIFKITLENDLHKYSFNFGASINDSVENSDDVIFETHIDFYCGYKFPNLKHKFLSYSDKIEISAIKKALENNTLDQLIDTYKAETIYNTFIVRNTTRNQSPNTLSLERFIHEIQKKLKEKAEDLKSKQFGEGVPAKTIKHPNEYDVLACLTKYDPGTFEDFCSDFGYDQDSRKAYKTYKAVMKEWKNIELLFTEEQLEQLQEIS